MLILPALVVTLLPGFMAGWTTFILATLVISDESRPTVATSPYSFQSQYASQVPGWDFAAMSIKMTLPVLVLCFLFQRWFISGPSVGAVKGQRG